MASLTALSSAPLKDVLLKVASAIGIDVGSIEQKVKGVMQDDVKFVPIRHHSPESASMVKQYIKKLNPKLVLIECPSGADEMIPYMVASDTEPPFAMLSMFTDDENVFQLNGTMPYSPDPSIPARFQVHYPFISYSPELVALNECTKKRVPVHFIDLPFTGLIPFMTNLENKIVHFLKQEEVSMSTSSFYQKLVDIFHFDDFNEVWDTLFEIGIRDQDVEQVRENILYFCACVRQALDPRMLELDGTLAREQCMAHLIEKYVTSYRVQRKDVMVITGGMHSIALPGTARCPVAPAPPAKGLLNTLVPYSYFRLSDKSGYGSGNQGPVYYEQAWNTITRGTGKPYETIALDFITNIIKDARDKEQIVSIADSISAYQNSKMLAHMRRRHEPCMKDIIDAVYMTVVKGNPAVEGAYLQSIMRDRFVGHKIGRVTKKIGRLPLQADFYLRFESLGIQMSERPEIININLKSTSDVPRSILFWRVKYLGLDVLRRTAGPDVLKGATGILTETWVFQWHPGIDMKLIELNIYGSTVEEASRGKLLEELKKEAGNYDRVTNLLYHAITMGFSGDFDNILQSCMDSLDIDDNFLNIASGFLNVIMIFNFLSIILNQDKNIGLVKGLLSRNFYAACFALPNFANPKEDMVDNLMIAVKKVATTIISFSSMDFDKTSFMGSLKTCIATTTNEFIKGCCTGIMYLLHELGIQDLKDQVVGYLRSEDRIKAKAGEFVRGIIFECQSQFLFNPEIIRLLDDLVGTIEWPIFAAILPSLKKSFSVLSPREYEIFAEKLSESYGLKAQVVKELKDEIEDGYLALFGEINEKVRNMLDGWFGGD